LKEDRLEKLKNITVSTSEARRIAIQTDEKNDEEFEEFLEKVEEKRNK